MAKTSKKYTKKAKVDAYQAVTDRIMGLIEKALEDGSTLAPWHKPWNAESGAPRNLVSKKPYRGINALLLGCSGFSSPYWASFKQIKEKGGHIKQGEKATMAVFFKWIDIDPDENNPDGKRIPFLRYYNVFNIDQTEGVKLPKVDDTPKEDVNPITECEEILTAMKDACNVKHGGNRAYYSPTHDYIQMPEMKDFDGAEEYYSTRFHETVHSTGHESRLNRPGVVDATFFGSTNYSQEELVAEMGAAFLCGIVGIDNKTAENSAAYLRSWLKKLADDPKMLVQAAGKAQKAVDHILGTTFEKAENNA